MYTPRYIQYVNFPEIPKELIECIIPQNLVDLFNQNENKKSTRIHETYTWTDDLNEKINVWGQQNICPDMYYAFQLMTGPLPIHKDRITKTKLNYIVSTGGDNIMTTFYDEDRTTELASYNIPINKWHLFKADTYHSVGDLAPGQIRLAVTARIFG